MKRKFFIGIAAVILCVIAVVLVLANEHSLVFHPKGIIAQSELELILTNIALMLAIILPTYILLFVVIWKYCINKGKYDPDHSYGKKGPILMWGLPSVIVAIMAIVTWKATHHLNPYKPIESDVPPLTVQVVALDWKWLFIYPDQGIATLNYFVFPERTPIHLKLTADGSPMNSFWLPELSGQIYAMTGMSTQLYIMADGPGEYAGRAVEINGDGYSDMTFQAKSTSLRDFNEWIAEVKKSEHSLTNEMYLELVKRSINKVTYFSDVEPHLFHHTVHKYMYPAKPVL